MIIGIIGAGQMGTGIAQNAICSGLSVHVVDRTESGVATAAKRIDKALARLCEKGRMSADDHTAAAGLLKISTDRSVLAECDVIIEAISEDEATKAALYAAICPLLKPTAILVTNTSSISITRLATYTDRPDRFAGMHFMNPVPVMKLVELIAGLATSHETMATITKLAETLGKTTVVAKDYPGFIVNRVLIPMLNEACFALMENVGSVEAIDAAMTLGCNQPMGPLTLADFIGLDVVLAIMEVLHEGYGDPRYRPCPLLRNYVAAGWLGRKSGRGFYDYSNK